MAQFTALLAKNFILYRRNWFGSFMEIFIPILFALFFLIARLAYPSNTVQAESFAGQLEYTQEYYSQELLKQFNINLIKSCTNNIVQGQSMRNGLIFLGPPSNPLAQQLNNQFNQLGYNTQMIQTNQELNKKVSKSDYGKSSDNPYICFSLFIESPWPNYSFRIRFNISDALNSEGPSTFNPIYSLSDWNYWTTMGSSRTSGLFQVNNIILNNIVKNQTQNQNLHLIPTLAPIGHGQIVSDQLFDFIKDFIDIFTLFPCIIIFLRMTSTMLKEKQKKIRQIMKVMGMSCFSYYATWIFKYFCIYLIAHIFVSLIFFLSFSYVDYSLIFVTFILFDIVLILQSLFIQIFFMKSVLGTLTAMTFFFIQFIGSFVIKAIEVPSDAQLIAASICPFTPLVMIMESIFYSNFERQTLTWSRFSQRVYNYRISYGIASLLINIAVWTLLTLYFQQVFPSDEGIKKHPLFFCGFPFGQINNNNLNASRTYDNIGRVPGVPLEQGIYFHKVWKVFGSNNKAAVKDLSLQIQRNSIFTLLGHNGAGKTTTLAMMAGISQITKGEIFIQGISVKQKSHELKKLMGFCPQHNTLYDELTVYQHLQLFSYLKNLKNQMQVQFEIESLLNNLELSSKRNQFPENLSGGQRRRLQLALSFVGGSKIIFLDEPTSGLDSYSRRKVWNFIKKKRTGKIIILTTHFMDQAEILSDRLAIMKDGRLACCGTPHGLKQQFQLGYRLNIEKQNPSIPNEPIVNLVRSVFYPINVQSTVPSQLTIRLPTNNLNKLALLFDQIQMQKHILRIRGYGVNTSTLQQVILFISSEEQERSKFIQGQSFSTTAPFYNQISMRDTVRPISSVPNSNINLIMYTDGVLFFKRIWVTICKRILLTFRNFRLLLLELIIPAILVLIVLGVQRGIASQTLPAYQMTPELYNSSGSIRYIVSSTQYDQQVADLSQQLLVDNPQILTVDPVFQNIPNLSEFDRQLSQRNITKQTLAGVLITNSGFTNFSILSNTKSVYSALVNLNTVTESIINVLGSSNISITPILDPLPKTQQQISNYQNPATSFLVAIIFSIALSFKYGSSIYQVVKERQSNCKHLQIVSGMGLWPFWIGNFIFDFGCFVLFTIFTLCMCKALNLSHLIGNGALGVTVAVFVLYGVCQQIFTYVCSFMFRDYNNAQSIFYFFNFMFGAMMPVVVLVFRYIGQSLTDVGLGLAWVFRFIPSFCFGEALINLESRLILSANQGVDYRPMDGRIALYDIIYLGSLIPLFMIILILIQACNWTSLGQCKKYPVPHQVNLNQMDPQVAHQFLKTQQANPAAFPILMRNLSKVYQNSMGIHLAVNNLNLTLQQGEVFGLLGVNGAGKSTTFKMLTRDIISTNGQIYMNGNDIERQFERVKAHVGYCPQFSALFERFTVRQQLALYYRIKGFHQYQIQQQITNKLKMFNIEQYQHFQSKDLSGGNQRKLSMAIALIGNPSIILLDEPSTGVDPYSKRFMWKIINNLNTQTRKTTVVLTTHSMEQAEYLSTRIGIMANGTFKCLGSLQRIKNSNSDGFYLELKIKKIDRNYFRLELQKIKVTQQLAFRYPITSQNVDLYLNTFLPSKDQQSISVKNYLKQICLTSSMSLYEFLQRVIYEKQGQQVKKHIMHYLSRNFSYEHDGRDWRFNIKDVRLISKAIILMQRSKHILQIEQYHINSTTLQDILNKLSQREQMIAKQKQMSQMLR